MNAGPEQLPARADVVICGAGIAGIAAAHRLAVHAGVRDVLVVDEGAPLSLTSDKSTEAYRNWWPGPDDAMVRLMNRSIDLLEGLAEESDNVFRLNRRGYVYATASPEQARALEEAGTRAAAMGAGPLRRHTAAAGEPEYVPARPEGYAGQPTGADLILDRALLHRRFAFLSESVVAVLHARRCGWFSGQQLGMYLLERARERGVRFVRARLEGVEVQKGRVRGVDLRVGGASVRVAAGSFVDAAGPLVNEVASMMGVDLPVFSERHLKVSFRDHLGVIPRDAPLLVWEDPQQLPWTSEERQLLGASEQTRWLLGRFPPSVHARPEGGPGSENILLLWPYDAEAVEAVFPLPESPAFPEVVLRGMSTMIPGLREYFDRMPSSFVDGGYYTKTRENRFLACPLAVGGAYVLGALSGYGLMAACGAAELLAAHVTGSTLPDYASAFALERYDDPAYRKQLQKWGSTGQL
ncbi:MAG: NAD(P)/FAD-dependent oxidoreductase [Candidatus Krumholzibacteriia bacterium]